VKVRSACSAAFIGRQDGKTNRRTGDGESFAHSNACNCKITSDEHYSFSAVDAHNLFRTCPNEFLNVLTVGASMTCCGMLLNQSLTTLLEKNVLRTVVVHLGLKSFWL